MRALIFENIVVDVRELDYDCHPDYNWVDCQEDCASGWSYNDGVISPPSPIFVENVGEHVEKREEAYPPIGDQLDALFHAGVFPEEMAAQLKAVKDQFPKE